MSYKKVSAGPAVWVATFVASYLVVGTYASFSYSQHNYALASQRISDMTASFLYGGMLGGWLGVLGVLLSIWLWNGTAKFLEECAVGLKKVEPAAKAAPVQQVQHAS